MTTFEEWLRQLAKAGKLVTDGITIDRGLPFTWTFALDGNWTGAVITSSLRLEPDTSGSTLVDFTAVNDGYDAVSEMTEFTISLTALQTTALLSDTDADGLVQLAWDVLFTPSGGTKMRLLGGAATVAGKVTNG